MERTVRENIKWQLITVTIFAVLGLLANAFLGILSDTASAQQSSSNATYVSTGYTSACAIADGKLKCWGENSYGKLGNGSTRDSSSPVAVVSKAAWTETIPAHRECTFIFCNDIPEKKVQRGATVMGGKSVSKVSVGKNHTCAIANATAYCWGKNDKGQLGNGKNGWLQQETEPVAVLATGNSALKNKEIVDISAGDDFSCALASDGVVACWGEGDNGRLGTNSTSDKDYPVPIYSQAESTRTEEVSVPVSSKGGPSSGERRTETRTVTTPASALNGKKAIKLAKASETTMCVLAVNATSTNAGSGNAYCWGTGIDSGKGIPNNTRDVVACGDGDRPPNSRPYGSSNTTIFESTKPTLIPGAAITAIDGQDYITGLGADGKAYYWGMYGYKQDIDYSNVRSCWVNPCTGRVVGIIESQRVNDNLDITLAKPKDMGKKAKDNAKKGNSDNRGKPKVVNGHPGMANYQIDKDGGGGGDPCKSRLHYGFTKTVTNTPVGKKDTTQPPQWPGSQSGMKTLSGNVYNGLFCANGSSVQCDAHGTSQTEGQTGSGFAQTCKLFGGCTPSLPSGPQAVVTNGWLAGKTISQLSTGSTGYTCAVASGTVGCWGVNTKGQLGTGDRNSKNVPTRVGL